MADNTSDQSQKDRLNAWCNDLHHGAKHDPLCPEHQAFVKNAARMYRLITEQYDLQEQVARAAAGLDPPSSCDDLAREAHRRIVGKLHSALPLQNFCSLLGSWVVNDLPDRVADLLTGEGMPFALAERERLAVAARKVQFHVEEVPGSIICTFDRMAERPWQDIVAVLRKERDARLILLAVDTVCEHAGLSFRVLSGYVMFLQLCKESPADRPADYDAARRCRVIREAKRLAAEINLLHAAHDGDHLLILMDVFRRRLVSGEAKSDLGPAISAFQELKGQLVELEGELADNESRMAVALRRKRRAETEIASLDRQLAVLKREKEQAVAFESFVKARGGEGLVHRLLEKRGIDPFIGRFLSAPAHAREILWEALRDNLDRANIALDLLAVNRAILEEPGSGLTALILSEWIGSFPRIPLATFVAAKTGRLVAEASEKPASVPSKRGPSREERKRLYEAQRSVREAGAVEPAPEPPPRPTGHLRLDLSGIKLPSKVDQEAVKAILTYAFFRLGEPASPSRWGTPVTLDMVRARCGQVPDARLLPALEWLCRERVVIPEKGERYLLNQDHSSSRYLPFILDRLFALESA